MDTPGIWEDTERWRGRVERWRSTRLENLTAPGGWLSVVGLWWLHEGTNTIGSSEACDVVLPGGAAPTVAGTIELADGRAILRADPGSGMRLRGEPVGAIPLSDGWEGEAPTRIRIGTVSFHLIRREDQLAVRVRDSESDARRTFTGIEHYPVDERWRLRARFEPTEGPGEVVVPAVAGPGERYAVPGVAVFEVDGIPGSHRLTAFLEAPDDDLFFVFGDATSGTETYGGGRFLYAPQADEGAAIELDFNRAYNPPCVFTPFATCPVPLPENRLRIRVEAGELVYRQGSTPAGEPPNPSG
jgi:uncharacterized protein (DUF1684 family)